MSADALTLRELGRATLARQLLLERERLGVVEAVERLGCLQAQEPRPPHGALWTRLEGFRAEDLRAALQARELLRATLMRATLHLVSAADYPALRPALQPVMTGAMSALRGRDQGLELAEVVPAARRLFRSRPRTFEELRALLSERFPGVNERALGYAVRLHLPLAMVPTEDRFGFPRVASFELAKGVGRVRLDGDADRRPLVRRYLGAFGPATPADMQTWSGLGGLKATFEEMRDELAVFAAPGRGGGELFDLPDAPRPDGDVPAPPRVLPEFDSLVLAHKDRRRVLAEEHRAALVTKNLRIRATFLLDGEVRGTWRIERKARKSTLTLEPFGSLPRRWSEELRAEAEAMLRFMEGDAATLDVTVARRG